jgi:hypothetical protein
MKTHTGVKTFLRTTLFWFVVAIVLLVLSGFGRFLSSPLFDDYYYLIKVLPSAVVSQIRYDAIHEFQVSPELCVAAETACVFDTPTPTTDTTINTTTDELPPTEATTLPANRPQDFQQPDNNELLIGQANLSQQINTQFQQLSQQISLQLQSLATICQGNGEIVLPIIDETAQKKAELQAQIDQLQAQTDQLQAEMQNL